MEITKELIQEMIGGKTITVGKYTVGIKKLDYGADGYFWGIDVPKVHYCGVCRRLGERGISCLQKALQIEVEALENNTNNYE